MSVDLVTLFLVFMLFDWSECESIIQYFLYDGGSDTWNLLPSDGFISTPLWNINSDVKVLIHGYNPNLKAVDRDVLDAHFMTILAKEYANYDSKLNILVVDWKNLSTAPLHQYFYAVRNVRPAAMMIANYLASLIENWYILDLDKIHILGLSLGAHVAGAVGFQLQKLKGGKKVSRITGLDPAGPGFSTWNGKWPKDMSVVLDYSDAKFVDIIHTNAGPAILEPILSGKLGTDLQTGHIDFYPNGGSSQMYQCNVLEDRFDACSHQMSVLFYAQALRQPYKYIGCPCNSFKNFLRGYCPCIYEGTGILLGELTKHTQHGRYYMIIKDPLSADSFE